MRTAVALGWPWKDSSVTVGSCVASSSRKERKSTINSLLERLHADAPVGVEEALSLLPQRLVDVGRFLDGIDNAVFIEAGPNDLGQACVFRRSEEHTSELQSLMRLSYAVFCLKKK